VRNELPYMKRVPVCGTARHQAFEPHNVLTDAYNEHVRHFIAKKHAFAATGVRFARSITLQEGLWNPYFWQVPPVNGVQQKHACAVKSGNKGFALRVRDECLCE